MSTYYMFYIGKRNTKTGAVDLVGPYYKNKEGEIKVSCVYDRSRSFIHWDEFRSKVNEIDIAKGSVELQKLVGYNKCAESPRVGWDYCASYWLPAMHLWTDPNDIVVRGYIPHNEMEMLITTDYNPDVIEYELPNPLPAEVYAEMSSEDRAEYGHVAYVNKNSTDYICNILSEFLTGAPTYSALDEDEELGMVIVVS